MQWPRERSWNQSAEDSVSQPGTPTDVWVLIGQLEDTRRDLYAREKEANAHTRWWLLLPMLLLLAPAVLAVIGIAAAISVGDSYGWLILSCAVLVLLFVTEVWLGRKVLAGRWVGLSRRRELRRSIAALKERLANAGSRAAISTSSKPAAPMPDELVSELEHTRHQLVELTIQSRADFQLRYLLAYVLPALLLSLVILAGIVAPLALGLYGVLGATVPMVALLLWLGVRLAKKSCEPEIISRPRRRQLKRRIEALEAEIVRVGGGDALRRQPGAYAQRMWRVFPFLGSSPVEMLQRLPQDSSPVRLWFHRHVGWGVIAAFLIAALILTFYILARAAGW